MTACRLVEQRGHVHAGQRARREAERGESAVPAAHVGVGEHDVIAGLAGQFLERRAWVGDDHEPARDLLGREPEIVQGLLVDAPVAVGLDRGAALARHDHQCAVKPVAKCARDLMRVGGVEYGQRSARRARDHLGREGRATHACEHDVVEPVPADALGQVGELAEQSPRDSWARPASRAWSRPTGSAGGPHNPGSLAASLAGTPSPTSFAAARPVASVAATLRVSTLTPAAASALVLTARSPVLANSHARVQSPSRSCQAVRSTTPRTSPRPRSRAPP